MDASRPDFDFPLNFVRLLRVEVRILSYSHFFF